VLAQFVLAQFVLAQFVLAQFVLAQSVLAQAVYTPGEGEGEGGPQTNTWCCSLLLPSVRPFSKGAALCPHLLAPCAFY